MGTWWQGTALVAERGLVETVRSRSFKIVTGLLLLLAVAAVVLPQVLGGKRTTYTLATVGTAPAAVVAVLDAGPGYGVDQIIGVQLGGRYIGSQSNSA